MIEWIAMTCIVGITTASQVYIGADRGVSDPDVMVSMAMPKVCSTNGWIFGYSGSIGTGQLFEFIDFPEEVSNPYKTLRLDIVEQYKAAIASFGSSHEESYAEFLIGYDNILFEFNTTDWSVIQINESAIGSGSQLALGSLHTSIKNDTYDRVHMALEAAIHYSLSCQGPIDIICTN